MDMEDKVDLDFELPGQQITDDELIIIIKKNNEEMQKIINNDYDSIKNNEVIKKLFFTNCNLYNIAKRRGLRVDDYTFLTAVGTSLGYYFDDYYAITDKIR